MNSPVAREMGTLYPFIQGAMSWITDVPEFASRVADAGGLPTIALGLMDAEVLDRRLGHLPGNHGSAPLCSECCLFLGGPLQGDATGLDKETGDPGLSSSQVAISLP